MSFQKALVLGSFRGARTPAGCVDRQIFGQIPLAGVDEIE